MPPKQTLGRPLTGSVYQDSSPNNVAQHVEDRMERWESNARQPVDLRLGSPSPFLLRWASERHTGQLAFHTEGRQMQRYLRDDPRLAHALARATYSPRYPLSCLLASASWPVSALAVRLRSALPNRNRALLLGRFP